MPKREWASSAGLVAVNEEAVKPDIAEAGSSPGRVPDFFIVGHQKCGTTALWEMLRRHPQIFMPRVKEPRYFASDLRSPFQVGAPEVRRRHTPEGYFSLFTDAGAEQLLGEGSPQYLRSGVAASRIAEVQPAARIIAILREPASFLRSFHLQALHNHIETERDLGKAIALEPDRRQGRHIPRRCHQPQDLLYSEHVRYVEQLRRYHAVFPRQQVLVLIYEDFRRDNEATVHAVLRFLELDDTLPIEVVETKPLKVVRSLQAHKLRGVLRRAERNPAAAGRVSRTIIALTPRGMRGGRSAALLRRAAYVPAPPPDEQLMLELRRRFKAEVVALSDYLGRDLVALWGYDRIG
jgi:hypothetical protein